MKKWKTVKDEYHNINNILNFHRSTMHHKSNMSVNHIIPVIDNLLTKDNEEDSRIVEIDPAELKENEDEFFKILEQRRTSWQFGTPMNREQLSALLTKACKRVMILKKYSEGMMKEHSENGTFRI